MNVQEQLKRFKGFLDGQRFSPRSPILKEAVKFLRSFPGEISEPDKEHLKTLMRSAFGLNETELVKLLSDEDIHVAQFSRDVDYARIEKELQDLLPPRGYFRDYAEYTRHSMAPLAYHFYCALIGVAATLVRRIWFDMGYFRVFPSLGVILLGPSGLKKTSAADIVVSMLRELELTKIYSEKLTPEALVEAMKDTAQGLIYAPEMTVFLGRQKYNEGLVELITRFYDCPDRWESGTIMRGKHLLTDVGICGLMCSTPDWFTKNVPEETFGGGFIARNLLVMQEGSPRIEPIPKPGDPHMRDRLLLQLAEIHELTGEVLLSSDTQMIYEDWFFEQVQKNEHPEHEILSTYYQRKPIHAIRLAMCMHVADHRSLVICSECFIRAIEILGWTEQFLPLILSELFKTATGEDAERVLQLIKSTGGRIDHSSLVRKMQSRMNAQQLRIIIASLKEGGRIKEVNDHLHHLYILEGGPDGRLE